MSGARRYAKPVTIVCAVLSAVMLFASLLPAGFAIYLFESPGSGFAHDLYVWAGFLLLVLMPLIALAGVVVPWIAYRRDRQSLAFWWAIAVLALFVCWLPFARVFYLT